MPATVPSLSPWDQLLQPVQDALRGTTHRPCLTGLHGSATAFALTLLAKQHDRSWLIVSASDEDAERLYDDLTFFHQLQGLSTEPLALFPEWETLPYESTPPLVELVARRMRTLHRLTAGQRTLLVTSV